MQTYTRLFGFYKEIYFVHITSIYSSFSFSFSLSLENDLRKLNSNEIASRGVTTSYHKFKKLNQTVPINFSKVISQIDLNTFQGPILSFQEIY